jgi:hypothetical protein
MAMIAWTSHLSICRERCVEVQRRDDEMRASQSPIRDQDQSLCGGFLAR